MIRARIIIATPTPFPGWHKILNILHLLPIFAAPSTHHDSVSPCRVHAPLINFVHLRVIENSSDDFGGVPQEERQANSEAHNI
jgi:hypothetical protein